MPRVIIQSTPRSPKVQRFVTRLAQELTNPGADPQPLILEEQVGATQSRHVRVIWDQWKKLPDEERSDAILEAYRRAEGSSYADQITIAIGLTSGEALALGLLPWKVEPILSGNNRLSDAEYGRALEEEERNTVLGIGSIMKGAGLRYPRKEDAEQALRRLRASLPRSSWSVSEDVYSE